MIHIDIIENRMRVRNVDSHKLLRAQELLVALTSNLYTLKYLVGVAKQDRVEESWICELEFDEIVCPQEVKQALLCDLEDFAELDEGMKAGQSDIFMRSRVDE